MMRSLSHILLCLALVLSSLWGNGAKAGTYNSSNIPIPENAEHPSYISNPDGILTAEVCARINERLLALEQQSNVRMLIMVVEHIEGDDPFSFSLEVGNRYGIGDQADNKGLILTLATLDRSYQILTGDGLEAELPDALCKRVENRVMVPELKKGDWNAAIEQTTDALCRLLGGDGELRTLLNNPVDSDVSDSGSSDDDWWEELTWWEKLGVTLLVIIGVLLLVLVGSAPWIIFFIPILPFYGIYKLWKWMGRHWCSQCHRFSMVEGRPRILRDKSEKDKFKRHTTWTCKHCQHEKEIVEDYEPTPLTSSSSSSSYRSSSSDSSSSRSSWSSHSSSGSSHGSRGGGHFSGGGAGGRF